MKQLTLDELRERGRELARSLPPLSDEQALAVARILASAPEPGRAAA